MPFLAAAAPLIGAVAGAVAAGDEASEGQDPLNHYNMDREAFNNPRSAEQDAELARLQYETMNRQAAQAQAAQRSQLAQALNVAVKPAEQAANVNLGAASQGLATTGNATQVDRSDADFRSGQSQLVAMLQQQAAGNGPSLAEGQLKAATDRTLRQQMAMAATQGGVSPALAQRRLSLGAAAANRQAGIDAAQLRIQEQLGARSQLAGALGNAREQDIGVNTTQAGLTNQLNLANLAAQNQFGLANMDARNQFALQGGQMRQQNNQFNAGQSNAQAQLQAQLQQQTQLANVAAANEMHAQNAANRQATNLANLQAEQNQRQLNDQTSTHYLDAKLSGREADRQAAMSYEKSQANVEETARQREQNADDEDDRRTQQYIGGAVSAIGGVAGAAAGKPSDPAVKRDLRPMSGDRRSFAQHLASQKVSDPRAKRDLTELSAAIRRGKGH